MDRQKHIELSGVVCSPGTDAHNPDRNNHERIRSSTVKVQENRDVCFGSVGLKHGFSCVKVYPP